MLFICDYLKLFFVLCLFSLGLLADTNSDRLLDLEAQIASLKAESAATKALAEQERANTFNPSISVVTDILGQYAVEHDDHHHAGGHNHSHNGIEIREVEIEFRAAIDPWADGLVVLGVHNHHGHAELHLEEAYALLKKWPGLDFAPLGLQIKAGKFRTAFGRMNRVHLHNAPQIEYPLALRAFLGDEGFAAPGLSLTSSYAPSSTNAWTFYAEGLSGVKLPMQEKGAEKIPAGLAHLWWHSQLADSHLLDFGASSLFARKGNENSGLFWLAGADIHYSFLPAAYGQNPMFLVGSEFFLANPQGQERIFGNFTWAQVKLIGASFLGLRYDLAPKEHDKPDLRHALSAYFSYYTTEFLRFRLGYEHVMPQIKSLDGDHRVMLSMNFILGSHPVEPYFANR